MAEIVLSWPHRDLSSNARKHRLTVSRRAKVYRHEAWALSKKAKLPASPSGAVLTFTYHPPDERRRDAQNMPHMLKSAIDGISDALRCDDANMQCVFPVAFDTVCRPHGAIVVKVDLT